MRFIVTSIIALFVAGSINVINAGNLYLPYVQGGIADATPTATTAPTATSTPGPTPTATATTNPGGPCPCSGDTLNCGHFDTQREAQACMNWCNSQGKGDIHNLDGNNDGEACESLPGWLSVVR